MLLLKGRELLSDLIRLHIVFGFNCDASIDTGRDGIGVGRWVLNDRALALAEGEKTHGASLIASVEGVVSLNTFAVCNAASSGEARVSWRGECEPYIDIFRNGQGIARGGHAQSNPGVLGVTPRDTEGCIGEARGQLDRDGTFGISDYQRSATTFRKVHRVGAILTPEYRPWHTFEAVSAVQPAAIAVDKDEDVKIDKRQDGNRKVMGAASRFGRVMVRWGETKIRRK